MQRRLSSRRERTKRARSSSETPLRSWRVRGIDCGRLQRVAIDIVNCLFQVVDIKEGVFQVLGVLFETFVNAEAGAGGTAELTAWLFFFAGNMFGGFANQIVVSLEARPCRSVGKAFGSSENLKLAFGDTLAIGADPGQRVIFLGGAHVDQHPFKSYWGWFVWFCGIDDGRQVFDFLFKSWVGRGCVFPDLVGIGGKVDVGFVVAVEDARFFVA